MKENYEWQDKSWTLEYNEEQLNDSTVFYVDLCPCDDVHNYVKTDFVPEFVNNDTHQFDTEPPHSVFQVATPYGWAIVAKWFNNGSTRLYANGLYTIMEAYEILHGRCDSGDCSVAFGEYIIRTMQVSEKDMQVFYGKDMFLDMFD